MENRPQIVIEMEELEFPPTSLFISCIERVAKTYAPDDDLTIKPCIHAGKVPIIDRFRYATRSSIILSAQHSTACLCAHAGVLSFLQEQNSGEFSLTSLLIMSTAYGGKGQGLLLQHISGNRLPRTEICRLTSDAVAVAAEYAASTELPSGEQLEKASSYFTLLKLTCIKMFQSTPISATKH